MFSYAVFAVFAGGGALRDASGNVSEIVNGTLYPACASDHVINKFNLILKIFFNFLMIISHVNMDSKTRTV